MTARQELFSVMMQRMFVDQTVGTRMSFEYQGQSYPINAVSSRGVRYEMDGQYEHLTKYSPLVLEDMKVRRGVVDSLVVFHIVLRQP